MHLMAKGKRVANISKVTHDIRQVLEIFMLGLKSSGPVIKKRSKPGVIIMNKEQSAKQSDLLLHQPGHMYH